MKRTLLFLWMISQTYMGISQCMNTLSLGPDTTVCVAQPYVISAGAGYLSYNWNTGSNSSSITVTNPGQYYCTVESIGTTNLVSNGNFSSGNTGFTSSYVPGTGGTWGLLSNPGEYAISTNANLTHNNFPSCTDHTSGTGNYMIMNGSSVANTDVWCQTVTVSPSTQYEFSAWFTSVVSGTPAQLNFSLDGVATGSVFTLNSTVCNWTRYAQTWTSGPTQTTVSLCITSQSTAGGGNDFAIDDINFSTICSFTDTVNVAMDTLPVVDLGADTIICSGASFSLDATDNPLFGYQWSDGTSSALNTLSATDSNLVVSVTNGSCEVTDDMIVTFSSQPNISLGNDTVLCPGDLLSKDVFWPNASYLWNDNSTLSTLSITQPGMYWVEVTDNCGTISDTINVAFVTFPLVDLGQDTQLCVGQMYDLNASYPFATYTWNTGVFDSLITVSQSGSYSVAVQLGTCIDRDTVQVTFDANPVVDLGPDTTLCTGEIYYLQANNLNATYLWNDNSVGALKNITTSGIYWVEVTINNCKVSDTVSINVMDYPTANLGNDTILCGSETILYDVNQPFSTYLWNDNSVNSSLLVSQSAQVWVEVSNFCGVASDTVNVYVNPYPEVDLGNDTVICEGESFSKDVFVVGGSYLWSDGSTNSVYDFNTSGVYVVTVTAQGCATVESLDLSFNAITPIWLGEDTVICNKARFTLSISDDYDSILWQDGSTGSEFLVLGYGKITVTAVSGVCHYSDTIWIGSENCDVYAEMPNIFTPNGDGVNDEFIPIYSVGIVSMKTMIYDRWGQAVFESVHLEIKWDGKNKKGDELPSGTYFWISEMVGDDGSAYNRTGSITLAK